MEVVFQIGGIKEWIFPEFGITDTNTNFRNFILSYLPHPILYQVITQVTMITKQSTQDL